MLEAEDYSSDTSDEDFIPEGKTYNKWVLIWIGFVIFIFDSIL